MSVGFETSSLNGIPAITKATDARGYIYIVDRANTGLHILEVAGEARRIAGPP